MLGRILGSEKFKEIKRFFKKYERHISSVSLIVGFIIDNLTLRRIDLFFDNLVLVSYLVIITVGIVLYNSNREGILRGKNTNQLAIFLPVVMQFAFGGLFSGSIVFYSRSASFFASWPFLLVLVGILISGEMIKGFYKKITYQMTIFFLGLFSYLIFYVPIITNRLNKWMFFLSGVCTVIIFYLLLRFLKKIAPTLIGLNYKKIILGACSVFAIVNIFYFTNILPPIPLSLKEGGVFHSVTKTATGYELVGEKKGVLDWFKIYESIHLVQGEPVFVFSSVFAPTDLDTDIVHEWQYLNQNNKWETTSRITFPIFGGANEGYRGYSIKYSTFPGKWRVNVTNSRGQIIGRIKFEIERGLVLDQDNKTVVF